MGDCICWSTMTTIAITAAASEHISGIPNNGKKEKGEKGKRGKG